jgi:hypothetical protein
LDASATSTFEVDALGRVLILLFGADNSEVDESVIVDPVFQPALATSGNNSSGFVLALGARIADRSAFNIVRCSVVLLNDIAVSPCCLFFLLFTFLHVQFFLFQCFPVHLSCLGPEILQILFHLIRTFQPGTVTLPFWKWKI